MPMDPPAWTPAPPAGDRGAALPSPSSGRTVHRDVEVVDDPVGQRIDPAVDRDLLPAGPGLVQEHVRGDVADLADHVELAQPVKATPAFGDRVQFLSMVLIDFADRVQPVVDQAAPFAVDRCR